MTQMSQMYLYKEGKNLLLYGVEWRSGIRKRGLTEMITHTVVDKHSYLYFISVHNKTATLFQKSGRYFPVT